jgi:DNA-directed RNA polymerase specialized sigma24 family protein
VRRITGPVLYYKANGNNPTIHRAQACAPTVGRGKEYLKHLNLSDDESPRGAQQSSDRRPLAVKEKWSLTQEAFDKLLVAFSANREDAGLQYELMRRRLVRFFECRSVDRAEERADETINRVARRIFEGQIINDLRGYFYGVARMVFKEVLKERERAPVALDDAPEVRDELIEHDESERRFTCFDRCLELLVPENRKLILEYYREERRAKIELRRQLAERFRIPLNALRIRAHRIRTSLEMCISGCLQQQ